MADQIYFLVGSQQVGPIGEAEAKERVGRGEIGAATLMWHPGLEQWQTVGEAMPALVAPARKAEPAPAAVAEPAAAEATRHAMSAESAARAVAAADPAPATVGVSRVAAAKASPVAAAAPAAAEAKPLERRWESHGTVFEIVYGDYHQMAKITLSSSACVLEAGSMHYVRGAVEIQVAGFSASGFMKSALTKEAAQRPKYTGTGEVYLEPTLGEINLLELSNEEWVLDRGAFMASDVGVELGVFANKAWSGLFSGEGMFQTKVSGSGKVFFLSDGICQRIELHNDKLMVDGTFAVARSAQLNFSVEKATKGLIGSMRSGEGFVNVIQGTGSVLIAPIPNRSQRLFKRLDMIGAMLTSQKRR